MNVEILYFAELKEKIGKDRESFILTDSKLKNLMHQLFQKHGFIKKLIWDESKDTLKKNISIALNEQIINQQDKFSFPLSDGDKLAILFPFSGG